MEPFCKESSSVFFSSLPDPVTRVCLTVRKTSCQANHWFSKSYLLKCQMLGPCQNNSWCGKHQSAAFFIPSFQSFGQTTLKSETKIKEKAHFSYVPSLTLSKGAEINFRECCVYELDIMYHVRYS